MSPDMVYFAAAERSISSTPNVYIYSFKTMRLYRILRKGTSKGYASVAFSPHNKEIFSIRWGQFPGMLTSVGVGHIRFWKMATTFTGLKLQGDLGKFGASELSDISGFVELPDGKARHGRWGWAMKGAASSCVEVIGSGGSMRKHHAYGKLLLWEGVFVKVELMRAKEGVTQAEAGTSIAGSPHNGNIEVILIDKENGMVISGGDDGHLRWWPIEEIDTAEADYDNGILEFGIRMRKEVRVPPAGEMNQHPAHIQHVVIGEDEVTWLIQDSRNGMIWIYDMAANTCTSALSCHSQQVTGSVVSSSYAGLVMSCGMDGTVRAFNVSQPWDNELYRDIRPLHSAKVGATCLDATPELVDPSKRTVCVGYTDGTIRAFTACSDGFLQLQALKPHNCMVKQLKYSPDEFNLLATLGEDNTIFFFHVQLLSEHAIPIGFVRIPVQVNYFAWDDTTGKVLLSLGDGSLLALSSPDIESVNNGETYEIEVNYTAVMPDVPEIEESDEEEEEDEEDGAEGEDAEAKEGEDSPRSPTSPMSPVSAAETEGDEEEGKKKKKKKKEEKPKDEDEDGEHHVEVIVTSVSRAILIPSDSEDSERKVVFTGTGRYSGGLWEGSLLGVEELLRIWLIPRLHGGIFASVHVSDGLSGAVNSVSMLEDESMLCAAAGDGSLVTFLVSDGLLELAELKSSGKEINMADAALELEGAIPEMPDMSMEGWSLPPKEAPGVLAINPDIVDADQYSIQDAKLKAEEDSAKAAAELKKLRVRERINEIRNELVELQAKNGQLYEAQLSEADMVVDQEYINHLKEDMENQIEQVRFELAWSVEFHERGLQKLKDYYLKHVDFERIEVLGFQSEHRVSTFRCAKMSGELQANLARLHELIFAAGDGDGDEDEDEENQDGFGFDGKSTLRGNKMELGLDTDGFGSPNAEKTLSGAEQRELRRQQRMARKAQMQELERAKPSESYEAPEDLEAIANAEATLGNYMLKTSEDYQVPENQRMNAEKKRRQMFLLEESIHAIKTEFNQRVLALRDFRQQVRAEVQRDLQALAEIDEQLGTTTAWVVGILENPPGAPCEFPETCFELQTADIKAFASKLRGDAEEPVLEELEQEEDEEEEGYEDGEVKHEAGEEEPAEEAAEGAGKRSSVAKKAKGVASQPSMPLSGRAALAARRVGRLTL
ncbi:unnamed protein product [Durusdinium trenchii]|uniref:Cilia- and flagella-associated protein 44 n=1 Tax=Durusdinium trenchii TaxID=1381693 RepID=A0ABP0SFK3_9DINO